MVPISVCNFPFRVHHSHCGRCEYIYVYLWVFSCDFRIVSIWRVCVCVCKCISARFSKFELVFISISCDCVRFSFVFIFYYLWSALNPRLIYDRHRNYLIVCMPFIAFRCRKLQSHTVHRLQINKIYICTAFLCVAHIKQKTKQNWWYTQSVMKITNLKKCTKYPTPGLLVQCSLCIVPSSIEFNWFQCDEDG